MSKTIIKVENLSKRYRIGLKEELHDTFFGELASWVKYPFSNFKRVQKLSRFNDNTESKDIIWALRDVSFEVKQGEVLGIIGKNGAGKSTLLKILCRIAEPTGGWAKVNGRVASLLEVGTGFHPELTGRENVFLNGVILGMKKKEIERKFDEIVDFSGVGKFIDTPVKRFSSGMIVRLAFSVAAHLEPEILFIDEVLAVGDVEFQKKCLGKMKNIAGEGRTVLFVSHNMAAITNLCNRAILLSNGKVVADGQPSDVVQKYISMGEKSVGEVVWPDLDKAPGNKIVRLHSVRILQSGIKESTSNVDIANDILVEITYCILKAGSKIYTAIFLDNNLGIPVFASNNYDSISMTNDSWSGRPHPKGFFQSVCCIPGNFLNNGKYYITTKLHKDRFWKSEDVMVNEEHLLSFEVHDSGAMRKHGNYGSWRGVVRPKLAWRTENISNVVNLVP